MLLNRQKLKKCCANPDKASSELITGRRLQGTLWVGPLSLDRLSTAKRVPPQIPVFLSEIVLIPKMKYDGLIGEE